MRKLRSSPGSVSSSKGTRLRPSTSHFVPELQPQYLKPKGGRAVASRWAFVMRPSRKLRRHTTVTVHAYLGHSGLPPGEDKTLWFGYRGGFMRRRRQRQ